MTVLLAALSVAALAPADFVVAPTGRDTGAGSLTDPFASLDRARLAVRDLRAKEPQRDRPVQVLLRGGHYPLAAPVTFTPADAGTAASPTVYAAWPGETPVLSGGRRLTGWTVANGRWTLDLPEVKAGKWSFSQLFVAGGARPRPRLPRTGYYHFTKDVPPTPAAAGKGHDRFGFKPGDLDPNWHNLADVEICGFNEWNMHRMRLQSLDPATGEATCTGWTCNKDYWAALKKGYRYLVDNVAEALDTPGQWYLDRPAGKLTYLPLPGEDPATTEVIAPVLEQLLVVEGRAAADQPVAYVQLQGLTFSHTNWVCPAKGHSFPQAEADLTAAVVARGAQHWRVSGCRFAHLGTWGVDLGEGCRDNRIEHCTLTDLGAGGLKLGTLGVPANEKLHSGWTEIVDNTFSHGGRLHPAAIGVWLAQSPHNTIAGNDIYDFYYTGISIGWTWGYGKALSHDNRVADNHVWQIGQGVLSDMGGIYTLGDSHGSTIVHNYFHDITAFSYGGWGIYFDEGTAGIVAHDNLVWRTKTGGFHQHYGKGNTLSNNILACARIGQLQRTRDEQHLGFTLEHNLVYWDEGPLLHGNWKSAVGFKLDKNLYWDASGKPVKLDGKDPAGLVADPLFVDAKNGNFALKADSPAEKVGFVPFALTGFGRGEQGDLEALKPMAAAFPTVGWR